MTPYSHLDRALTDAEWLSLRQWLEVNPQSRNHLGDERDDDRCFLGYSRGNKAGEHWGSQQQVDAIRARMRRSYATQKANNPDHVRNLLDQRKERKKVDPDFRRRDCAYKRKWARSNTAHEAASRGRRRLRRSGRQSAIHPQRNETTIEALYLSAAEKTRITGVLHHVDHIIPITYGGWHHEDNLQVLPRPINQSKFNNPFWEHPDYRSWRNVPQHLWPSQLAPVYATLLGQPPIHLQLS